MAELPPELLPFAADLAARLDLPDDAVPATLLLGVTRDVAHAVTRPAGPITTYLIGRAVAGGMDPAEAAARVHTLLAERA